MDEAPSTAMAESASIPAELPANFFPLRLLLQPSGVAVELDRPSALAGRLSTADVRLPFPDVSRRHCQFIFVDGGWKVIDLESLNGVWLNEERVQQSSLSQDDRLTIGGFRFVVDLSGPSADSAEGGDMLRSIIRILPRPRPVEYRRAS